MNIFEEKFSKEIEQQLLDFKDAVLRVKGEFKKETWQAWILEFRSLMKGKEKDHIIGQGVRDIFKQLREDNS